MASSVSFYIKNDSVAGVYPYIHRKIIIDDVIVLDERVSFSEVDDALKTEYVSALQNTLNTASSSLSIGSFSGDENISNFYQLSRLLETIAANIPGTELP